MRSRGRAFRPPAMTLEQFTAEPVPPPAPPAPPLHEIITRAVRADRIAYGRPDVVRVAARLDRVALIEILLRSNEFGPAWRTAATRRLRQLSLRGGAA
jgi:hypothetical protein